MITLASTTLTVTADRVKRVAAEMLFAIGLFICVASFGHCNQGCAVFGKDADPPSVNEVYYGTELSECVEKAKTRKESRDCRREVNRRWGLCTTVDGVEKCP